MRIRFLKTCTVDVETCSGEIYDKAFRRWDDIEINNSYDTGRKFVDLITEDGECIHGVPANAFEKLTE